MSINAAPGWLSGFEDLMAILAPRFGRVEPRRQAPSYLLGLLSPLADKNGWTLAEAAGDRTPDKMQRLLNAARWDADAVRDDLRGYVTDQIGDPDGILIVDETGFVKKGVYCRTRHYSPALRSPVSSRISTAPGSPIASTT